MAIDWKHLDIKDLPGLIKNRGKLGSSEMVGSTGKYEINLVPDVKLEMIKLQKIRNLVFFVCLIVAGVAAGVVVLLAGVKTGQDIVMGAQDKKIEERSAKISNYKELTEFLTIQDQLNKLSKISGEKKVLSRVFNVLSTILPMGEDKISISELVANMADSTLTIEGQADAGKDPMIDYRVLESFKKSVGLTKFDHGRYVDAKGREIPTRCIEEADAEGNSYSENGRIYAIWHREKNNCDPGRDDSKRIAEAEEQAKKQEVKSENAEEDKKDEENLINQEAAELKIKNQDGEKKEKEVVLESEKIWRTPQFNDWYHHKKVKASNAKNASYKPSMTLDGEISDVPHFASKCIKYSGIEEGAEVKWSAENSCDMMAAEMRVNDSSNGRDSENKLVLRFNAILELNTDLFAYENKHVMVIGPNGQNVTDSYRQIEGMFAKKAEDCKEGDAACSGNKKNKTGTE